ncbi:MAG: translocation/assembly module TamB domain-containing protein [Spirochaetaceae bacterium]
MAALVLLTAAVWAPVQSYLESRMESLKAEMVAELEERIGRRITYESISPSILRAVEIRGLVINGAEGERGDLLEIDRLRLFYHPLRILTGRSDAAAVTVRITDSDFYLHHRRDADVVDLIRRLTRGGDREGPVFELSGRNVRLTYEGPRGRYEVEDVFFETTVTREDTSFTWESGLAVKMPESSEMPLDSINGRVEVHGTVLPDREEARLRVRFPELATPLFEVREQSFEVSYDPQGIEVHKLRNSDPVDVTVRADPDLARIEVSLLAERLVPEEVVRFRGGLSAFNPWLLGRMSGEARLSYDRESGALSYDADLSGYTNNPRLPEQAALSVRMSGDETEARVDELSVRPEQGTMLFSGSLSLARLEPVGTLQFDDFRYGPSEEPLTGVLRISRHAGGGLRVRSPHLSYGLVDAYDVDVRAGGELPQTSYEGTLSFDEAGSSRTQVSGILEPDGSVEADVRLIRVPGGTVADIAAMVTDMPERWHDDAEPFLVDVRAEVSVADGGVTFRAPYVSLQNEEQPSRFASFGAELDAEQFEIRHLVVGLGDTAVKGDLAANLEDSNRITFDSSLAVKGRSYDLEGTYRKGRSLDFTVDEGLDVRAFVDRNGDVVLTARGDDIPLPGDGGGGGDGGGAERDRRLSFRSSGSFRDPSAWDVRLEQVSITEPTGRESRLSFSARLGPEGGTVERFRYADEASTLSGEGELSYGEAQPVSLELRAGAAEGPERYDLVLRYEDGELGGTVNAEGSPLARFVEDPIRGRFGGVLEMEDVLARPRLTLRFETEEATFNADSVAAEGTLRVSTRSIVINRLNVRYQTHALTDARGTVDMESGEATLSAAFVNRERDDAEPVTARLRATVTDTALPLAPGDLGLTPFEAVVQLEGVDFPRGHREPWELRVRRTHDELRVVGGPGDSVDVLVSRGGEFRADVTDPLPMRFTAEGVLSAGELEANVTNIFLDVGAFATPVEGETISMDEGRFSGAVRIIGPVNDPDFFGTLEAEGTEATIDFIAETIGPAGTFLVFQEKVIEIQRFRAPVGRGYGYTSGSIILDRWTPEEYRVLIDVPDEPGVRVDYNFGGLYTDGYGRGELEIRGTQSSTDIRGDILVDEVSLTLAEQIERVVDRSDRTTTVDMRFETAGPTEFMWPNRDFPVLRALAQRGEELRLAYDSAADSFSLRGRMNIQSGEIYYFDRSFYIRDGRIIFDEDEEEFDPRLAVRAELREVSADGPVRVYLIVDEERLSSFTPRFESSPPMSDTELIALLGGDFLSLEGQEDPGFSQAVLLTGDLVTQFGVINRFERSMRDALGLDLFSVRTQLFQNLVLESITQPDYPLDNTGPSLGQYLENTSVFLGKYVGTDLFTELLLGVRPRSPFEPAPPDAGPVEFEAELGVEWQTPLFLLQWRFFPQNPETLFVTDNQLEFSWEFSY